MRYTPYPLRCAALLGLAGCASAPPRPAGAPPDLLLIGLHASPASALPPGPWLQAPGALALGADPAAGWTALLQGQWPGRRVASAPPDLGSVLPLYGYTLMGGPPSGLSGVPEGLRSPPLDGPCLADQVAAFAAAAPRGPAKAGIAAGDAGDGACGGEAGLRAGLEAALELQRGAAHPLVVLAFGVTPPAAGPEAPVPAAAAGPGLAAGAVAGLASPLDALPTAFARAGAVVPSDADGADLAARAAGAPGPPALFLQDVDGIVIVRTDAHRLRLGPSPGPGLAGPALGPAESLDGAAAPAHTAALTAAASAWARSLHGATAEDRAGPEKLRALLHEQGYWQ